MVGKISSRRIQQYLTFKNPPNIRRDMAENPKLQYSLPKLKISMRMRGIRSSVRMRE